MELKGTLGFLGFGNMGSAILGRLLETGTITKDRTAVFDVTPERCEAASLLGTNVAQSPKDLAQRCDTLVLAVKPQTMEQALEQAKPGLSAQVLVISIAAGISIDYFQDRLGSDIHVVRVMPNTPALVGEGAAGVALSANCSEADQLTAMTIFSAVGVAEAVSEEAIDGVTALSGSGPAYFFYMVECLVRAASGQGLSEKQATRLAAQTLLGAGRLLVDSGEEARILRERVTSKGGTTEAALRKLREQGFDRILREAVDAAANRSRELGQ